MMESHIVEAVRNNILGTWNLMRTASRHNVRSLLMISSDKAVNPVCVMGATKRVCERIVSACSSPQLKGVSVRFGNVLGSSGSVVPIFQAQIAAGGPIKVTHPEVRRYFMTASEAVSLVIQASANSRGAEIFVLDMGDPIRIVDLAENMIRLAGLVPHEDIEIQFTGLRPGEKLVEEIIAAGKDSTSYQDKIKIIRDRPLDSATVEDWMDELQRLLTARQEPRILAHIQTMVPEYKAPGKFLELVFGKTLPDETSNSDLAASLPEVPSLSNRKKNGKANGTAGTEEFNLSIP
jgi:FlaA1/EpsC-like NDP-sugar epimerase